jgi:cell division septum initiation protein DivIVA
MSEHNIMQEIEELRKQLQSLSAARGLTAVPEPSSQEQGDEPGGEAGVMLRDIVKQAEEVIGGLDLHLKDVPATTALMIFTLGVLTGRFLSRRG